MKIAWFSADLKHFTKEKLVHFLVILEKSVSKTNIFHKSEMANFKLTVLRSQKELAIQISQGFEPYQIVLVSSCYIDLALLLTVY